MNVDYRPQLNEINWISIANLVLTVLIAIKVFLF